MAHCDPSPLPVGTHAPLTLAPPCLQAPMRPSPSALFNNLAQAAGCVVYAHKCSVSGGCG